MNRIVRFIAAIFLAAHVVDSAWAHSSAAPTGVTGAPGEPTCAQAGCQDQLRLNSGPGAVELPEWFFWTYPVGTCPNGTTAIAIQVRQPGATRWGFEISVVTEAGASSGTLFLADPSRTSMAQEAGNYVFHTEMGTDVGAFDPSPGWTVNWVLDGTPVISPIRAYVAGVAADNDGTPLGDYVYTDSAEILISIVDLVCQLPGDLKQSGTITSQTSYTL